MSYGMLIYLGMVAWMLLAIGALFYAASREERKVSKKGKFLCRVFGHKWTPRIESHRKVYFFICSRCKVRSEKVGKK